MWPEIVTCIALQILPTSFTTLLGDLDGILALTSDLLLDFVSLVLGLLS